MKRYWYDTCPVCIQGRLFVAKRYDTGELFLLCEECYSGIESPEQANDVDSTFFAGRVKGEFADAAAIATAGWSKYRFMVEED